jgi:hypothetical protein
MKTKMLLIGAALAVALSTNAALVTVNTAPMVALTNTVTKYVTVTNFVTAAALKALTTDATGGIVADTNLVNLAGGTVSSSLRAGLLDLYGTAKLLWPLRTNGVADLTGFGGLNLSSRQTIYGAAITFHASDHSGIGILGANKGGQWFEGGITYSFSATNNWIILGKVRQFAGDGVVYNFKTREAANYAFLGFDKTFHLAPKWDLSLAPIVANTSDEAGVDLLGAVKATWYIDGRPK